MKTIIKSGIISVVLVLFLLGMLPSVAGFSSNAASRNVGPNTAVGTCPSQTFLSKSNVPPHSVKLLTISWVAKNDEDSGLDGYWALDHYTSTLNVWYTASTNTYYGIQTFSGVFEAPQGAVSPGSSTNPGNLQSESVFGTLTGGIVLVFNGSFNGGPQGNLGTKNYGGTISDILLGYYGNGQTGPTNSFNPISAYFSGGNTSNPGEPFWGFAYQLNPIFHESNSVNQWCNYYSGTTGDIYDP
jgi:hypothetical protein